MLHHSLVMLSHSWCSDVTSSDERLMVVLLRDYRVAVVAVGPLWRGSYATMAWQLRHYGEAVVAVDTGMEMTQAGSPEAEGK